MEKVQFILNVQSRRGTINDDVFIWLGQDMDDEGLDAIT